jgi:FkbH-like protein
MVDDWLPCPADFRGELRAALQAPTPAARLAAVATLASQRLGFVETIQVDRALQQITREYRDGFATIRLALLSNATVDHLAPAIRVAGLRRKLLVEVHVGGFGQYRQEVLDPASATHRFGPDFVLISLSAHDLLAAVSVAASQAEVDAVIDANIEALRTIWRGATQALKATVLQQTYLNVGPQIFGSYDRIASGAPARLVAQANDRLADAVAAERVLLVDVARASERDGVDAWFDQTRWFQAKCEIAPQAAPAYAELVMRVIGAQRGLSKKCLVLDLDNTLWGGTVGDDGIAGIVLGQGSAAGEAHLALQRYAKQLRDRGIVLAICSKNDPAIAEDVFENHPEMLLHRSDIASFVVNWDDKAANLQQIANQLNLGLDSLVFVDDNLAERARIRWSLPDVSVPELPADAGQFVRCLSSAGYFEAVTFTSDDSHRAGQYASNASRETLKHTSQSLDDYLRDLRMSVAVSAFQSVDLSRVTQLINKTNQFNPTTRRHSLQQVERFVASGCLTVQFRLIDRFGDNGLVSAMIFRPDEAEREVLEVDTWVMSCRVFGRGLECEALNVAVELARRRGILAFRADYIPTERNRIVSELYSNLGFTCIDNQVGRDGQSGTRWQLELTEYQPRPTHIARGSD